MTATVGSATRSWVSGRRRRGEINAITARDYIARLAHFERSIGADRAVATINTRHIEAWREELAKLAPSSQRSYWSTVRDWMRWCVLEGLTVRRPMETMAGPREPRSVPRWISATDIAATLGQCDDRARVVIVTMVQLGIRRGEMSRMRVDDLDFANGVALIRGKGGHERVIPIPDQAVRVLRQWLAAEGIRTGPVIRSRTDEHRGVGPATIGLIVTKAMRDAGVKSAGWDRRSAHSLRHTACADMLRGGAHVRDVQAVLGHASLSTTQRYMPLAVATLAGAVGGRTY